MADLWRIPSYEGLCFETHLYPKNMSFLLKMEALLLCRGNLVGVAPASAIFMAVYEPVKARLTEVVPQQQAFLAAGAIAGLAASFVRAPTEVSDPVFKF